MSAKTIALHQVIDRLDEAQITALYNVAVCFIAQNDFDYISPEESEQIKRAYKEIRNGDCASFSSAQEMAVYFGVDS